MSVVLSDRYHPSLRNVSVLFADAYILFSFIFQNLRMSCCFFQKLMDLHVLIFIPLQNQNGTLKVL